MRKLSIFFLISALFWPLPTFSRSLASSDINSKSFVWSILALVDNQYVGTFSPPQESEMYLLANKTNILNSRYTGIYYWPIDREYKPDWSFLNEEVDGTLEILNERGEIIETLEKEWYLLNTVSEEGIFSSELLLGADALSAYQSYEERREAYFKAVENYDIQLEIYLDKLSKNLDEELNPPQRPEPFSEILQQPKKAFILNIEPGSFLIRLRDMSGAIVPGSERKLTSVTPRRESIGFNVIPEAKWTKPETSYESDEVISYDAAGTTLYLQPSKILEYNEKEYTRITQPQDTISSQDRWVWVVDQMQSGSELEILSSDRGVVLEQLQTYSVQQIPSAALGYQIVPYNQDDSSRPDFEAFKISLSGEVDEYIIHLLDQEGRIFFGSERKFIRAIETVPGWMVLIIFAPIIFGLGLKLSRFIKRKRTLIVVEGDD